MTACPSVFCQKLLRMTAAGEGVRNPASGSSVTTLLNIGPLQLQERDAGFDLVGFGLVQGK